MSVTKMLLVGCGMIVNVTMVTCPSTAKLTVNGNLNDVLLFGAEFILD
jgi:hypothetical protein